MNVSWLKSTKDSKSFNVFKNFGMDVFEINNLEETDKKLQELIDKKYNTIFISNEVASFSQDIIKKYNKSKKVNIIIAPPKQNEI